MLCLAIIEFSRFRSSMPSKENVADIDVKFFLLQHRRLLYGETMRIRANECAMRLDAFPYKRTAETASLSDSTA